MPFGDSNGAFYEDEFHRGVEEWNSFTGDSGMVTTPNQMRQNQQLEDIETKPATGMGIEVGWKDNSQDFNNLPDDKYIQRLPQAPGLFGPIKEDMAGEYKPYADRAINLTKKMYDLYKSGDVDTVESVHDWENKTLGRGYNDTEAGQALKKESFEKYGSKTTMSKDALWETFMTHYQNGLADALENENIPDDKKADIEMASKFDRMGRPQINLKNLRDKLK